MTTPHILSAIALLLAIVALIFPNQYLIPVVGDLQLRSKDVKIAYQFIIVILCLGILRTEIVPRKMQDERAAERTKAIVQAIQMNVERTPAPSPTPNRDTMHVTQRTGREDPGMIARILDALRGKK